MQEWYYAKNGERHGPVSGHQIKDMAQTGQLEPTDLVWRAGMAEWAEAGTVRGLFASRQGGAPHPPMPAPPPLEEPGAPTPTRTATPTPNPAAAAGPTGPAVTPASSPFVAAGRSPAAPRAAGLTRLRVPRTVARILQAISWALCAAVVLIGGLLFILAMSNAESAPQEAAAGAIFSTVFIGAYVLARCVEKITRL